MGEEKSPDIEALRKEYGEAFKMLAKYDRESWK